MFAHITTTRRRGDFLVHEIEDRTRVSNPKTADVVILEDSYLVVPVHPSNPVRKCDTLDESMSYIERYLGASE